MVMKNLFYRIFLMNPDRTLKTNHPSWAFVDKRKVDRFAISKGVYALMSWDDVDHHVLLGQLIDINEKGCGIYYIAEKNTDDESYPGKIRTIRIIGSFKMLEYKDSAVVYDKELIRYSSEKISVRRCGIKFDKNADTCKSILITDHSTTHTVS
jgi:hypothetical protein